MVVGTSTPAIRAIVFYVFVFATRLTLPLLVLRVLLVDDVHAAFPTDDLVVGAALLHTGSDFHITLNWQPKDGRIQKPDSVFITLSDVKGSSDRLLVTVHNSAFRQIIWRHL